MGHNTRENTKILLKGAWVGGTMTVPGVSGGTMAMVLGIYDRLISSVSRVFKEPKQSIPFLLWFALGGAGVSCSFPEASACFYPPGGRFLPAFSSWELSAEGFP
ncbi:MAG: undecaprenyl phosphate translocase family protein [Clostridium sp.]